MKSESASRTVMSPGRSRRAWGTSTGRAPADDRPTKRLQGHLRNRAGNPIDRTQAKTRAELFERPVPERHSFVDEGLTGIAVGTDDGDLRGLLPRYAELGVSAFRHEASGDQRSARHRTRRHEIAQARHSDCPPRPPRPR